MRFFLLRLDCLPLAVGLGARQHHHQATSQVRKADENALGGGGGKGTFRQRHVTGIAGG